MPEIVATAAGKDYDDDDPTAGARGGPSLRVARELLFRLGSDGGKVVSTESEREGGRNAGRGRGGHFEPVPTPRGPCQPAKLCCP